MIGLRGRLAQGLDSLSKEVNNVDSFHTPDWVKDAVFYQIFPDRFAKSALVPKPHNLEPWDSPPTSHGFKGGDLVGVAERLDYLQDLGVNAIYFTPVFQSTANHRYHTYDYYHVDPLLGGDAALRTLLEAAHQRGMRVVLDGVFNHASRGFFQFNHILENGRQSPYVDWFIVHKWPLYPYHEKEPPGYAAWWNLPALPKFNTNNPAVREFLLGVGRYWIDFGIDGWRLDVPAEIDDDAFWQEFRRRVKAGNAEAYIVGEIWHEAQRWLRGDKFDAVMNYLFSHACHGFFIGHGADSALAQKMGYGPMRVLSAEDFADAVDALLKLYRPEVTAVQMNLLDSHDTPRFLTLAAGDESALRLATLFQMTYPGAPSIFYGDEIGMRGGLDPAMRRAMIWDEAQWNHELRDFFKRCIALRNAHPALRRGSYHTLFANGGVYAFARRLDAETVVVALNVRREERVVDVPAADLLQSGAILRDVWGETTFAVANGAVRALRLAPRSGIVLRLQTQ